MDDFERELKEAFLLEADQLLLDAEQCFLGLESLHSDPTIIEKIFRLAHSLKGSAHAVGFSNIGVLTHELESLLVKIKNGQVKIEASVVTLLLKCNDHLRQIVNRLKVDLSAPIEITDLLAELKAHLESLNIPTKAPESTDSVQSAFDAVAVPESPFNSVPASDAAVWGDAEAIERIEVKPKVPSVVAPRESAPAAAGPVLGQPGSKANAPVEEGIRVSLRRLEVLMNNIGELVILQTVLNQQKGQIQSVLVQKTITQLGKITKDIQSISMSLRMIPLKQTFQKLQRTVRDISRTLGKQVVFVTSGDETEMDKTVIDHLGDPLVHLIRNAVDHGIEDPATRVKNGKPPAGEVSIRAYHEGSRIVIEVQDDGHGLDPEKFRAKAIEKKLLAPNQQISDKQALDLVFRAGFSTKSEVTDISGRGVGMDVVKTNIEDLQGEIQIKTQLGKGTCFRVLLPLTLAIIDAIVVKTGDERYVVPIAQVYESVQPFKDDIHYVTGLGDVLSIRGENLPLYRLSSVLARKSQSLPVSECIALVIRTGEKPFAVLVDDIIGQQQVVIKRLGEELQNIRGFSGSAILGDGRAALILDLNELVTRVKGRDRSSFQNTDPVDNAATNQPIRGAA